MDVNEAATRLGVSARRVRTLIDEGRILARKSGVRWEIDKLPSGRSARRPLSMRSRRQLAGALHSRSLGDLSGQERARTARRIGMLRSSDDPGALLLDWWGGRPDERDLFVRSLLLRALAGDASGVRDTVRRRHPAYLATADRLSDRVATERAIRGLTLAQLAALASVEVSEVRSIERGRAATGPGPTRRVLRALDVVPSALPPTGASG